MVVSYDARCNYVLVPGIMWSTIRKWTQKKPVAQVPDEYEIRVRGNNMSIFQERGEKAFEDAGWLELKKSKTKLTPSHVTFERDPNEKSGFYDLLFPEERQGWQSHDRSR